MNCSISSVIEVYLLKRLRSVVRVTYLILYPILGIKYLFLGSEVVQFIDRFKFTDNLPSRS